MTSPHSLGAVLANEAVDRIAPLWPLDRFVAVNPFIGYASDPFEDACRRLERTRGSAPLLSPDEYLTFYAEGRITDADLEAVAPAGEGPASLHAALSRTRTGQTLRRTLGEFLDDLRGSRWTAFAVDEIGKWCAVHFDRNQTTWTSPWRSLGLYAAWREAARHDRNPEIAGLKGFRGAVSALPRTAAEAIDVVLDELRLVPAQIGEQAVVEYLERSLQSIAGWAGYCRYLDHEARLQSRSSATTLDLLAIRLAFEFALARSGVPSASERDAWRRTLSKSSPAPSPDVRLVWQRAYELNYQRELDAALLGDRPRDATRTVEPQVQAVFCIDVRSEVIRRHIETVAPDIATLGFAGFFGFALAHEEEGTSSPRCPVLVAPQIRSHEDGAASASLNRALAGAAKAVQHATASTFSVVETLGIGFVPALLRTAAARPQRRCERPVPHFDRSPDALDRLAATAAAALRNMSLTTGFARLVLLCGHGSASANNPHAASLDCGACGGQSGEVNARVAAKVLNEPGVRARLADAGIRIPAGTWFIAGVHDTMTQEVLLCDTDTIPGSHADDVRTLATALSAAADRARRERADATDGDGSDLLRAAQRRSGDASQVRPEWALANNGAFIAAPRSRTRGLDLGGRVFLNEYDSNRDRDGAVLELILAAPVVVASWINLQYYASRVDPATYGAGSKVLHNVVGGLGVSEGNSGDLRVGLPRQSLHDGRTFRHEPMRLAVYIEAPRTKLDAALARQPNVRSLFENGWLHLVALEHDTAYRFERDGTWSIVETGAPRPAELGATTR